MTVAPLFALAIGPVCLILGFDTRTLVRSDNIFGTIAEDKEQFLNVEDYASLTFVGDHIANPDSHMATPQRDEALVLLQI